MPQTVIRGNQILNNTVQRQDLDVTTVGQAVATKIIQGTNVSISSTGADSGTGDVTISVPGGGVGPAGDAMAIGSILMYGSTTAPAGWMICDGSAISRATYPALFSLVGTTFGPGDGSTTFNLPDLRSRVGVGAGQGAGLTNRVLAASGGEETHQLTLAELASHNHTQPGHAHTVNSLVSTGSVYTAGSVVTIYAAGGGSAGGAFAPGTTAVAPAINATGSDTAHNTMQPFLVLAFIIKVSMGGGPTAQAPIADSTQSGLLRQVSGLATDFIDGTNNSQPLQPVIWSARLRSFNAIGNPTFEVDQRNIGNSLNYPAGSSGQVQCDRWAIQKVGATAVLGGQRTAYTALPSSPKIQVPGTNFRLSNNCLGVNITTSQATLATGDYLTFQQSIEGPRLRELIDDVHSLSLLVYCNTAPLKFSVTLRDSGATVSLTKLVTLSTANVWILVPLPNLPLWSGSGGFSTAPGVVGYTLAVCLAAGTTLTAPAADTWQNGNFIGAPGMDNFLGKPANTNFYVGFIQHEPGALCTTPIDCPFTQNYDECLRYYQKTYSYSVKPGTLTQAGMRTAWMPLANANFFSQNSFVKPMAKVPTVLLWDPITGANSGGAGGSYYYNNTTSTGVNTIYSPSDVGYGGFVSAGAPAAGSFGFWHHTADTGW